jgi:hypothetical protein
MSWPAGRGRREWVSVGCLGLVVLGPLVGMAWMFWLGWRLLWWTGWLYWQLFRLCGLGARAGWRAAHRRSVT